MHESSARADTFPVACDGVSVDGLAEREGTPLYVYSATEIRHRYQALDHALGAYPHRIHYALKANSTLGITRLIRELGGRVDANSGGEIEVALRAGFSPDDIVFTGVGKTGAELELAVRLQVHAVNAESRGELERIDELSQAAGVRTRVALRVKPDVAAGAHPHISTGQRSHKFGLPLEEAEVVFRWAAGRPGLHLAGVHTHIGSQLLDLAPLRRAGEVVAAFAMRLREDGIELEHLDLGGGLGIAYDGAESVSPGAYASSLVEAVKSTGLTLVVEPGRWIVGPAGALVTRVVDVKQKDVGRYFVVVDAGMSELLRPALYGANHRLELPAPRPGEEVRCDIVGPICETSDVFGTDRRMPLPVVGDLIVVRDAGAYGSAMASNYNRHPLPAEVLVDSGVPRVIRRRQTVDDMLALEI